jgi:hypothetical protein
VISTGHPERETARRRVAKAITPCLVRPTLRRTLTIAGIVGCVLTLINEGDVLIGGHATAGTAVKIVLNFCVPFIVSNLGVIAATRASARNRA